MKTYKQLVIMFLLLLGCFHAEGTDEALLRDVLQKAFPDCQISMTSGSAAALRQGEALHPVQLETITEFGYAGDHFLALVVVFNHLQETLSVCFRRGDNVDLPSQKNQLILARLVDPLVVSKHTVDDHALGTARHEITIKDMIGDDTSQLVLAAESVYPLYHPRETGIARRLYLYALPDLKPIAATTSKRGMFGENGFGDIDEFDIDFVAGKAGTRVLRLRNRKDGVTRLVDRSPNGRFNAGDEPWVRQQKQEPRKASHLALRVVDSSGAPVSNAAINGFTKKINLLKWSDTSKPFKAKTGKNGDFEIEAGDGVGLTVQAEGYYPVELFWSSVEVPLETVLITLEKAEPAVKMIKCTRTRKTWEQNVEKMTLGVRLIDGDKGKWKDVPTDNPQTADLWAEVKQSADADWNVWTLKLSGKNGWRLAPGSIQDDTSDGRTMRKAPKEGYQEQLEYKVSECPQGFYLQSGDGKRYGKIWGFRFEDRSRGNLIRRYMWIRFAIQAEETGNRSLNPQ
jgi:hypothetical protein